MQSESLTLEYFPKLSQLALKQPKQQPAINRYNNITSKQNVDTANSNNERIMDQP